jgi:DNA-binding NarL/FixJ family response regulator
MAPIRVLIVDDHPIFRFGMQALLRALPEMEVLGEAASVAEALAQAADRRPDVVLMDIALPDGTGIDATRRLRELDPGIAVLIVSMLDDDSLFAAIRAGARGYLLKGADPEETVQAIHAVAAGEAIFSPGIAKRMIDYFAQGGSHAPAPKPFPELTDRERDVLRLIAQGLTNAAIAERLALSSKTVRNYTSEIFGKLQVADRAQAILLARDAGLAGEPA